MDHSTKEKIMQKLLKFMAILMIVFGLPTTAKALTNADDLVGANGWIHTYLAHKDTVSSTEEYSLSSSGYYDNNGIWIATMYSAYHSLMAIELNEYDSIIINFNSDTSYDSIPLQVSAGNFNNKTLHNIKKGNNSFRFNIEVLSGQINIYMLKCSDFISNTNINTNINFSISNLNLYFHNKNEASSILKNNKIHRSTYKVIALEGNHIIIKYQAHNILGNR